MHLVWAASSERFAYVLFLHFLKACQTPQTILFTVFLCQWVEWIQWTPSRVLLSIRASVPLPPYQGALIRVVIQLAALHLGSSGSTEPPAVSSSCIFCLSQAHDLYNVLLSQLKCAAPLIINPALWMNSQYTRRIWYGWHQRWSCCLHRGD